jgi:hypothetical protein
MVDIDTYKVILPAAILLIGIAGLTVLNTGSNEDNNVDGDTLSEVNVESIAAEKITQNQRDSIETQVMGNQRIGGEKHLFKVQFEEENNSEPVRNAEINVNGQSIGKTAENGTLKHSFENAGYNNITYKIGEVSIEEEFSVYRGSEHLSLRLTKNPITPDGQLRYVANYESEISLDGEVIDQVKLDDIRQTQTVNISKGVGTYTVKAQGPEHSDTKELEIREYTSLGEIEVNKEESNTINVGVIKEGEYQEDVTIQALSNDSRESGQDPLIFSVTKTSAENPTQQISVPQGYAKITVSAKLFNTTKYRQVNLP